METYLELLRRVRDQGVVKDDRTGVGTRSLFGHQLRFDLGAGFPLLTTKKVHFKSMAHELLWFLRGESHIGYLRENGVKIWNEWADEDGELGPVYGVQWRSWPDPGGGTIDQIARVIEDIRQNPISRRLVVSAWNPADLERMALPPCHVLFQFYVECGNVAEGRLSCHLYQRSADIFLGLPFNIASYSMLTMMVARITGYEPGEFILSLGDVHLYSNHTEQADLQLGREPRPLPRLEIDPAIGEEHGIDDFRYEHFRLLDYDPHPVIKAPIAV